MKDQSRSRAIKWNLMLLAGRPLAFVGCYHVFRGLALVAEGGQWAINMGIGLFVIGFIVAWTGKIGKALFV